MARSRGAGPVKLYAGLVERGLRARIDAEGIAWVDDPSDAEAALRSAEEEHEITYRGPALSAREAEILEYLADGWSNEEIADRLGISVATVKFHVAGLFRKLGVGRRTEAVREGLRMGIVEI